MLQNNGSDALTLNGDGDFVFPAQLSEGQSYAVTVAEQPSGQIGSVSGTLKRRAAIATAVAMTNRATKATSARILDARRG